jgi:hypothetical protein
VVVCVYLVDTHMGLVGRLEDGRWWASQKSAKLIGATLGESTRIYDHRRIKQDTQSRNTNNISAFAKVDRRLGPCDGARGACVEVHVLTCKTGDISTIFTQSHLRVHQDNHSTQAL